MKNDEEQKTRYGKWMEMGSKMMWAYTKILEMIFRAVN